MERITIKHLQALVDRMNRVTGSPLAPYVKDESGKYKSQVGNFHISQAYGGYCVHRMGNEAGGITTPIDYGHEPARALYEKMHAWLRGFEAAQRTIKGE